MTEDVQQSEINTAFDSKIEAVILLVVAGAWWLLIQSANKYAAETWFNLLVGSRIFLFSCAILLAGARFWKKTLVSLPSYFLLCACAQTLFGTLENSASLEFYQYISYFLFLAALTYSGPLRTWFIKYFSIFAVLLITPLFSKNGDLFKDTGTVVFNFTTPICLTLISLIIVRANASRHKALRQNLKLKSLILAFEQSRKKEIEIEVAKLREKIEKDSRKIAYAEIAEQVYHDIKSPIQALDIAVKLFDRLEAEERTFLEESVSRIAMIVDDLGERAQLDAPKTQTPNSTLVNAADAIQALVSEKIVQLKKRELTSVTIAFAKGDGVAQLKLPQTSTRILSNLIDNAVEAIENQGTVEIRLFVDSGRCCVSVEDDGKGISSNDLTRIFDRGISIGKAKGTGLGLYTCKQLAVEMGGDIAVESDLNIGSKFTMVAPLTSA